MIAFVELICFGIMLITCPEITESIKGIDLSIRPHGRIIEGDTVFIVCEAIERSPFDAIRLTKLINGTEEITISTNDVISAAFHRTGRYRISEWTDSGRRVQLQISHIQGVDGGNIGCKNLQGSSKAVMDVIVHVPVSKVEIRYQKRDGEWHSAADNSRIQATLGNISCNVTVIGNNFKPEVKLTVDGIDVTSHFRQKYFQTEERVFEGFVKSVYSVSYESNLNDLESASAGKTLVCWAKTVYHEPKYSSVVIDLTKKPLLRCVKFWNGRVGQRNVTLACQGTMDPGPERAAWLTSERLVSSWHSDAAKGHLLHTEQNGRFSSKVQTLGNSRFEFSLTISKLIKEDFKEYVIEVTNEIGFSNITIQLLEVESTQNMVVEKIHFPETGESSAIVHGSSSSSDSVASVAVTNLPMSTDYAFSILLITVLYFTVTCHS